MQFHGTQIIVIVSARDLEALLSCQSITIHTGEIFKSPSVDCIRTARGTLVVWKVRPAPELVIADLSID